MPRRLFVAALFIMSLGLIAGCGSGSDKGDYILSKEYNSNDVPTIGVVHQITRKEASSKSLAFFLENDEPNDVIIYHVKDIDVYDKLTIGDRVTVTAPYTMLSNPPQAVVQGIIRHSDAE